MHSNAYKLFLKAKSVLYSSALVVKLLTIVESCFKLNFYYSTVKLKASLLLNALLHIGPLTFITELSALSCCYC